MTMTFTDTQIAALIRYTDTALSDMQARMGYCSNTPQGKRNRAIWQRHIKEAKELRAYLNTAKETSNQ